MKAHAHPTKEFFIDMITRDIGLDECIFDLLDNCIDGANNVVARKGITDGQSKYEGFVSYIALSSTAFSIKDNCGGISLNDAIDYAFHFGRRPRPQGEAILEGDKPIGLYGIGMKRAVFKIGRDIAIRSATAEAPADAFSVSIDVDEWAKDPTNWDFDLEPIVNADFVGTEISITSLKEGIAGEFSDSAFETFLMKEISKYYSSFIQNGFAIYVNDKPVSAYGFQLRESEELKPIHFSYVDEETGVTVQISAGLAGLPPDDVSSPELRFREPEYWGWFVLCNDRLVLAADKSSKTVWGGDVGFPAWHPQYNGFMGIVSFSSDHAVKLPWTTTKREIDETEPLYRRAVVRMKDATRPWLDYTNTRKGDIEEAKALEEKTVLRPINNLTERAQAKFPVFVSKPRVEMATIQYQKPKELVLRVAESLGNRYMTYKAIGEKTFAYYVDNELGE